MEIKPMITISEVGGGFLVQAKDQPIKMFPNNEQSYERLLEELIKLLSLHNTYKAVKLTDYYDQKIGVK